jgi:hypothetical protein
MLKQPMQGHVVVHLRLRLRQAAAVVCRRHASVMTKRAAEGEAALVPQLIGNLGD